MSSISKLISKAPCTPLKLREMTPVQRILAKTLIGNRYNKKYIEARLAADKDLDFDRDCGDLLYETCSLDSSDVPKSKRTEFAKAFGDSLVVDTEGITIDTDRTWDANNKRVNGVTIREHDGELCVARTFVPEADDEPDDTVGVDDEMVAVPYACGKGVTMHAWVAKRIAGDMMGH
jgi:hypothetical protein